jgi:hypothetical protein
MKTQKDDKRVDFIGLCKELGRRINGANNALLCWRAYQAYLREHPDSARGKGNKLDRDPSSQAFRRAAAEASGLSAATVDALLQVGKSLAPLPPRAKKALMGCSLTHSMRMLRKLATKAHDQDRAAMIREFAEQEKADPRSARIRLQSRLGMIPSFRQSVEAKMLVAPESHDLAQGEYLDMLVGRYLVHIEVGEFTGGRIRLTAMAFVGEKKSVQAYLGGRTEKSARRAKPLPSKRKPARLAA